MRIMITFSIWSGSGSNSKWDHWGQNPNQDQYQDHDQDHTLDHDQYGQDQDHILYMITMVRIRILIRISITLSISISMVRIISGSGSLSQYDQDQDQDQDNEDPFSRTPLFWTVRQDLIRTLVNLFALSSFKAAEIKFAVSTLACSPPLCLDRVTTPAFSTVLLALPWLWLFCRSLRFVCLLSFCFWIILSLSFAPTGAL